MTITTTLRDAEGSGTKLVAVHEGLPAALPPEGNEDSRREALT